jgi:histidine triad (HIT) family protein
MIKVVKGNLTSKLGFYKEAFFQPKVMRGIHVTECLGCRLANKKATANVVFENDYVCCILDHDPFSEGHVMILPKEHVENVDELDDSSAKAVMDAARLMSKAIRTLYKPDGITICQNGGVFSELTHFHMHVVPRFKHQSFADFYLDVPLDNDKERGRLLVTRAELEAVIKAVEMSCVE